LGLDAGPRAAELTVEKLDACYSGGGNSFEVGCNALFGDIATYIMEPCLRVVDFGRGKKFLRIGLSERTVKLGARRNCWNLGLQG